MPGTTDTVKTILTPGEFVIRKEAVDMIGVPMLNMINNMPEKGGHSNIDKLIEMATTENMKGMYGGGMVKAGPKPMGHGGMVDAYRGGGMVMDQYGHGGMVKNKMMSYGHGGMVKDKMMMMEKGGQLKPVPEDNPGLGKLPEKVRNRMGYMQDGGEVVDYLDTAGLYNRFLIENDKMVLPNKDLLIYKSLQNPDLDKKSYSALLDAMSPQGATFAKDASITSRLLSKAGMKSISDSDSLKLVKGLSPECKRMYESYFLEGGMQEGGMVDDSLMGMMGGGMAMKKNMMGMQEGGGVMLPPQPMDPLQIGARQADPSMYEGSTLGAMRDQAMMLQDSIEQDTVNKAKNSLKLMALIDSLRQAGAGESVDYMPMRPMPSTKADSMKLRDLMEFLNMQQMQRMSQ